MIRSRHWVLMSWCLWAAVTAVFCVSSSKEPSQQRVKRWAFGIDEVLKDPVGREQFLKFLESEFSSENLRCDEADFIFANVGLLHPEVSQINF